MAEDRDEIEYEDEDDENSGFFRWLQMVVVLFALFGFFGLAWYAYKSGDTVDEKDVELIKTERTPVKEVPTDPGGMHIPNQDKTVYGLINGNKSEKPVVERILPPTEEPVQHKADTDTWMSERLKNRNAKSADAQKAKQFSPSSDNQPVIKEVGQGKKIEAPAIEEVTTQDAPQLSQQTAAAPAEKPAAPPAPRPAKAAAKEVAPEEEQAEAPSEETKPEPPPAPAATKAPAGTRIQLGAFKSEQEAKQEWAKLMKKFSDELGGKKPYIVHVVVKGKNYYRLQAAPFDSPKDANELCMTLVSMDQGCFLAKDK